jgi:ribosomal protein L10
MKASLAHKMKKPEANDEDYETRKDSWVACDELEKLSLLLKGNTGIIFSNGDLGEIKKVLDI